MKTTNVNKKARENLANNLVGVGSLSLFIGSILVYIDLKYYDCDYIKNDYGLDIFCLISGSTLLGAASRIKLDSYLHDSDLQDLFTWLPL